MEYYATVKEKETQLHVLIQKGFNMCYQVLKKTIVIWVCVISCFFVYIGEVERCCWRKNPVYECVIYKGGMRYVISYLWARQLSGWVTRINGGFVSVFLILHLHKNALAIISWMLTYEYIYS